ncbi:glutamine amidotransferase [Trichococcus palustris]|jgi:imidazole glycerol-phosphate synthase subunit HisH|uniref:Imidazole glycerol phosphate synthase subunit HisH n=1 Tax=Trichococcus palustris TaxID=140314 RepID=A0A143YHI7_9LACT|nr:imidazole glycerol phosphate synthase subunit HisH [Trichococcus palustris]CZQ90896.1 glutamine amidotransferase [Trichococcus palustris]SFL19297.1 glutamine amidotransferase [Trichococcus palustris]
MIAIVDYGLGNIANLMNAIHFLGYETILTHDEEELRKADIIVLPGVGHFRDAMERIAARGLQGILTELKDTKPFIGICLGMQLLFKHSEEGDVDGLGFLPGEVKYIVSDFPVPHLGWNNLHSKYPGLDGDVYFIHSYKVVTDENVVATADYGQEIVAIVQKDNIIGIQFHPEKSGDYGLKILNQALQGGWK